MTWGFDARHLRTLEAVVRLGSFGAAASELGYTQSAVSQQIADLERQIGARTVTRRPVRVTEAGAALLRAETAVSAAMSTAAAELAALGDGTVGTVRLGAFISAASSIVPPALARLRRSHPGVRLTLREMDQRDAYGLLRTGEIDVAITFDYAHAPDPAPDGIAQRHLMDDPIMVVLPAAHRLAGADSVDPADVPPDSWIHTTVDVGGLTAHAAHGSGHPLEFDGQDFRTALTLVAAGLGVTLLPRLVLTGHPAAVAVRPLRGHHLTRRLFISRLATRGVSVPVQRLEAYLRATAAEF